MKYQKNVVSKAILLTVLTADLTAGLVCKEHIPIIIQGKPISKDKN